MGVTLSGTLPQPAQERLGEEGCFLQERSLEALEDDPGARTVAIYCWPTRKWFVISRELLKSMEQPWVLQHIATKCPAEVRFEFSHWSVWLGESRYTETLFPIYEDHLDSWSVAVWA